MRVLVTGGAGFIGGHVCRRLLAEGHDVVALDNFDPFYDRSIKEEGVRDLLSLDRFILVEADVLDAETLKAAARDVDAVLHLAARTGVRPSVDDPVGYHQANVLGWQSVLDLAVSTGIRTLVLGSSSSVYGNGQRVPYSETDMVAPLSPYAVTKRSAELMGYCYNQLYGLNIHCLRFFTVYGPRQRPDLAIHKFARRMLNGDPIPIFGDGTTSRDYTYVADIAAGVAASLELASAGESEFEIINLGNSEPISLRDMIDLLETTLGVQARREWLPPQPGDAARTFADITKAQAMLGYRPAVSFEDGLRRFADWLTASSVDTIPAEASRS